MMREAARVARNTMLRSSPDSLFSRYITVKSIARAIWRQDIKLAEKIRSSSRLGRDHLEIDAIEK
eukprot:3405861-Pyramimonas_sp.AAC.1